MKWISMYGARPQTQCGPATIFLNSIKANYTWQKKRYSSCNSVPDKVLADSIASR
jgi:hypothetical protein